MIPTIVLTNNRHLPLLRGFSYLWNKYAGEKPVTIFGFDAPGFKLPDNFVFHSLGEQLPVQQWSKGLRQAIEVLGQKSFILLLEDFWFYDRVNWQLINLVSKMMDDTILRIDLSGNRASYTKFARNIGQINEYDIIETGPKAPYQMSYQAGIWHSQNLLNILRDDENPWESEINGSNRVRNLRIIGTHPAAMYYQPVWRTKKKSWQLSRIKTDDIKVIKINRWCDGI